jgi:hypothetical protein
MRHTASPTRSGDSRFVFPGTMVPQARTSSAIAQISTIAVGDLGDRRIRWAEAFEALLGERSRSPTIPVVAA